MAAYNGCKGTVIKQDNEVLGVSNWEFTETSEMQNYSDNTTNCAVIGIAGPVETTGTISVNLQKGSPLPFRARDIVEIQLHIDRDTEEDYFEGEVTITEVGMTVPISQELVTSEVSWQANARLVGHGSLADEVS